MEAAFCPHLSLDSLIFNVSHEIVNWALPIAPSVNNSPRYYWGKSRIFSEPFTIEAALESQMRTSRSMFSLPSEDPTPSIQIKPFPGHPIRCQNEGRDTYHKAIRHRFNVTKQWLPYLILAYAMKYYKICASRSQLAMPFSTRSVCSMCTVGLTRCSS